VFLAGFLAMLCLLYGAGLSPTNHVPRLLLDDLFYLVGPRSLPTSTTAGLVVAGGVFGLIMGGTQTFLLRWHWSHRIAWTIVCVITGIVSFGWLGPLDWRLRNEMFDRFGIDLPVVLRFSFHLVTGPLALFMVGWLIYALITGLALKRFLVRAGNFKAARIAESFD
jgi:hypothetical protein